MQFHRSASFASFIAIIFAFHAHNISAKETAGIVHEHAEAVVGNNKPVYGAAIGVIRGDAIETFGFGRISEEDASPPNDRTIFEIASISKVFTGTLLAEMAERNEMSLDDPLEKYLPKGTSIVQVGGRKITLLDVATHRSGLPRLPGNFWELAKDRMNDPYSPFTVPVLMKSLDDCRPKNAPGEKFEYSNFGFAILGTIMSLHENKSYDEFVYQHICKPLGMEETKMELSDTMKNRLAPGHDAEHKHVGNWNLAAFGGGGGLRSSVHDMLLFAKAALGESDHDKLPPDSPLAKAFELALERKTDPSDEKQQMGLGWHFGSLDVPFHTGQTAGYCSILIVDRKNRIAVIALTNSFSTEGTKLGDDIYKTIREDVLAENKAATEKQPSK